MAEFAAGVSVRGYQEVLKQKTISDVLYFRILNRVREPKVRLGTLNMCVDFGEGFGTLFYLVQERTIWTQSIAWYPPFEARLGAPWTIYVDWKVDGVDWNMNSY